MRNEVTIDLETLDVPGSKKKLPLILSIGACLFDSDTLNDYEHFTGDVDAFASRIQGGGCFATEKLYYSPVSLIDSMANGFTISPDTAKYWGKQSYNMVEQAAGFRDKVAHTFKDFANWLRYVKAQRVLANAPTFDLNILREAFEHMGLEIEIHFRAERDVRGKVEMMDVQWPKDNPPHLIQHHAVCDAIVEARLVQTMYEKRRYWMGLEAENEKLRAQLTEHEQLKSQLVTP